jgi:hypothetical protein
MSNTYPAFNRHIPQFTEGLICVLRHGIEFGIWNPSGKVTIRDVDSFLDYGTGHYGGLKGMVKPLRFATSPMDSDGNMYPGLVQLSPPKRLPATSWVEAIEEALSAVKFVLQLSDGLPEDVEGSEVDDHSMPELKEMIKKPGGDLLAIFAVIRDRQSRGG